MRWDRSDSSDDEIYLLVRHELQELNKQAGVLFIRRHTDRKQGELYGDWNFRRQWTSLYPQHHCLGGSVVLSAN